MRKFGLLVCCLLLAAGCLVFDRLGPDGEVIEKGVVTQLADGANVAGAVGIPYAGLAGSAIGILGLIGAWFKNNESKRNLNGAVELFEVLKPKVVAMTNREDLKKFIVRVTEGTKFGRALKRTHAALKKI